MDDDESSILRYLLLTALLLLSAFFSGTETAFFSLSRLERNSLLKTPAKHLRKVLNFILKNQDQILITVLTGNMIVNIFASAIAESIGHSIFQSNAEILSIVSMTILLLLIGELTPKNIAIRHSLGVSRATAYPVFYLHTILLPLRFGFEKISKAIISLFPGGMIKNNEHKHTLVLSTARMGYNQQILNNSEYKLFKSYFKFKDKTAHSAMIPRNQLITVNINKPIEILLDEIKNNKEMIHHSTILLHKDDVDHLCGWIHVNDLLRLKYNKNLPQNGLRDLVRDFFKVPESKSLVSLIEEMREENIELSLLVDEYGGTAGIIWFQNIIEDLLQAFYAPYRKGIEIKGDKYTSIPGDMPVEEFEDLFHVSLETEYETIAGIIYDILGEIPVNGEFVCYKGFRFRVNNVESNRIISVNIEKEENTK